MKSFKIITLLTLVFITLSCANLNGPHRDVTITNDTDVEQTITIVVTRASDTYNKNYTIQAHDTIYFEVIGGYKIEPLNFRYQWKLIDDGHWGIVSANQKAITIIKNLPVSITLKDNNVSEFSSTVAAQNSETVNMYYTEHDFTLDNTLLENGNAYIEKNGNKYFYKITQGANRVVISLLS